MIKIELIKNAADAVQHEKQAVIDPMITRGLAGAGLGAAGGSLASYLTDDKELLRDALIGAGVGGLGGGLHGYYDYLPSRRAINHLEQMRSGGPLEHLGGMPRLINLLNAVPKEQRPFAEERLDAIVNRRK